MRSRVWIFCGVALAVCLLLFFLRPARHRGMALLGGQDQTGGDKPGQQEHSRINATRGATEASKRASAPPEKNGLATGKSSAASNAMRSHLLAEWQAPIEFYGKVVDENGAPVAGVEINFSWVEVPAEDGNRKAVTRTGSDGLFSLRGARGPTLGVSVSKEGYYSSRKDSDSFNYGSLGGGGFLPDPGNPVVFHLRKKGAGEPLIRSHFPAGIGQIAQLRHDGTPIEIDLLNGQNPTVRTGQLKLEFWRDASQKNASTFDWKLQISVPGGGLIDADDEYPFEAPREGYQPSLVVDMPATNQNWRQDRASKFYVHLADGKFGRVDLSFSAYNGVFQINSAVNPSGSRNLEPLETRPQAPPPAGLPPGVKAVVPEFK